MILSRREAIFSLAATAAFGAAPASRAMAQSKSTVTKHDVDAALRKLYAEAPLAKEIGAKAVGILCFPKITKAGFMVGGSYGEGLLLKGGKIAGKFSSAAASYGLQAGAQSFGYALFFMNDKALAYLDKSDGWEVGSGPSFVAIDKGTAKKYSSTTLTEDVYAFIFGQKGLMGGFGLEGSKITKMQ